MKGRRQVHWPLNFLEITLAGAEAKVQPCREGTTAMATLLFGWTCEVRNSKQ